MDKATTSTPGDSFKLKASDAFASKSKSVFDSLSSLEANHQKWQRNEKPDSTVYWKKDPEVLKDSEFGRRSTDTSFRPPVRRAPNNRKRSAPCNWIPDYKLHPEKYTKYSLASVSDADMSEKSNTAAAMDFLQKQRSHTDDHADGPSTSRHSELEKPTIKFRGSTKQKKLDTVPVPQRVQSGPIKRQSDADLSVLRGSNAARRVMPEYVVGASTSVRSKPKRSADDKSSTSHDIVRLDYLEEKDEEEDDTAMQTQTVSFRKSEKSKGGKRLLRKRDMDNSEDQPMEDDEPCR